MIEYMLRMYVMDQPSKWEDYLHLVEFSYNNGYHASLKMINFEALYGIKSNTPISCENLTYIIIIGSKLLKDMEYWMAKIKQNSKENQDRQKCYADKSNT